MTSFFSFDARYHSVNFSITCDPQLLKYLVELHRWINLKSTSSKADIRVKIEEENHLSNNIPHGGSEYGYNLVTSDQKVVYYIENWLRLEIKKEHSYLDINISFVLFRKNNFKDILKCAIRRQSIAEANVERLVKISRFAFHYPLFNFLRNTNEFEVYHGSVVSKNDKCLLFLGFDGIGKTTLSTALVSFKNFKLISDNFCILDKEGYTFPFVDTLRLNKDSLRKLGLNRQAYNPGRQIINTSEVDLQFEEKIKKVSTCYFLQRNKNKEVQINDYKKSISVYVKPMHNLLPEFVDFNLFESLVNLIDPYVKNQSSDLHTDIKTLHLTTNKLENLEEVMEMVAQVED